MLSVLHVGGPVFSMSLCLNHLFLGGLCLLDVVSIHEHAEQALCQLRHPSLRHPVYASVLQSVDSESSVFVCCGNKVMEFTRDFAHLHLCNIFKIVSASRTLICSASNAKERCDWMETIERGLSSKSSTYALLKKKNK